MAKKPTYEDLQRRLTELEKQIAGLRETETALRITKLWQERILNSLEEAVFAVTPDRKLANMNNGAFRMFGYSMEELANFSTSVLHVDQDHYMEFGKIIQETFNRDKPANFEFEAKRKNGEIFPTEHTVTLLKGDQGEHIGIVSVVRDITERKQYERKLEKLVEERTAELLQSNQLLQDEINERKQAERALQKAHKELERRVKERTRELEIMTNGLKEINTAMTVLLKKREEDKKELEDTILTNVKELVDPYLEKIKKTKLDDQQETLFSIIESNLNEIISPFTRKISLKYLNLTPTEIRIANLIRHGSPSKKIAEFMNVSPRTIDTHRKNIRRKIGLQGQRGNLRSHLLSLH